MPLTFPTSTTQVDQLLIELVVVLPAETAIAAVGRVRAVIQLLQDFVWSTAIGSVEGVLALGTFNVVMSFALAMWVASAVRRASIVRDMFSLRAAGARHYAASRVFVCGSQAEPCDFTAQSRNTGSDAKGV